MKTTNTQNQRILRRLSRRPGRWVTMPELVRVSGSYVIHSRVSDLRRMGYGVENKTERDKRGGTVSKYRLIQ